ncbi:MAG: DUF58 domain-containing protein [Ruminiclostridium sp.]
MTLNFKKIAAYIFVIGVALLFTLYLDAQGGCYLLIALGAAVIISVAVCIYTRNAVSAAVTVSEDILNRGDIVKVTLDVVKQGRIPSSIISAEFMSSFHFSAENAAENQVKAAFFASERLSFSADYRARFFGKGKAGIACLTVTDYLGLISFRINVTGGMAQVKVYPDIPAVNGREGLARSLSDSALFEESEETTQSLYAVSGTPGYEHRKYEPGDSLKLINWKLSAKKQELFVRRLEGSSGSEQLFLLDKACSNAEEEITAREEEQLAVEGMLGLLMQFAKSELPVKLMIRFSDSWEEISCLTPSDVSDLRYRLTDYTFSRDKTGRLPTVTTERPVIFSACCDKALVSYLAEKSGASAAVSGGNETGKEIWRILRDNEDIDFVR